MNNQFKAAKAKRKATICLLCTNVPKFTGQKHRVIKHILVNHVSVDRCPYRCELCNFRCTTQNAIENHSVNHDIADERYFVISTNPYSPKSGKDYKLLPIPEDGLCISEDPAMITSSDSCTDRISSLNQMTGQPMKRITEYQHTLMPASFPTANISQHNDISQQSLNHINLPDSSASLLSPKLDRSPDTWWQPPNILSVDACLPTPPMNSDSVDEILKEIEQDKDFDTMNLYEDNLYENLELPTISTSELTSPVSINILRDGVIEEKDDIHSQLFGAIPSTPTDPEGKYQAPEWDNNVFSESSPPISSSLSSPCSALREVKQAVTSSVETNALEHVKTRADLNSLESKVTTLVSQVQILISVVTEQSKEIRRLKNQDKPTNA